MPELARILKEARLRKGWSLRQAEERIAVSNAYLSQLETAKQVNPTLSVVSAICREYGLTPEAIITAYRHDQPEGNGHG